MSGPQVNEWQPIYAPFLGFAGMYVGIFFSGLFNGGSQRARGAELREWVRGIRRAQYGGLDETI